MACTDEQRASLRFEQVGGGMLHMVLWLLGAKVLHPTTTSLQLSEDLSCYELKPPAELCWPKIRIAPCIAWASLVYCQDDLHPPHSISGNSNIAPARVGAGTPGLWHG